MKNDITGKACLREAANFLAEGYTPSATHNAFDDQGRGLGLVNDPRAVSWSIHGAITRVNGLWFDVSAYDLLREHLGPRGVTKPVKGLRTENIDEWAIRIALTQSEVVSLVREAAT